MHIQVTCEVVQLQDVYLFVTVAEFRSTVYKVSIWACTHAVLPDPSAPQPAPHHPLPGCLYLTTCANMCCRYSASIKGRPVKSADLTMTAVPGRLHKRCVSAVDVLSMSNRQSDLLLVMVPPQSPLDLFASSTCWCSKPHALACCARTPGL